MHDPRSPDPKQNKTKSVSVRNRENFQKVIDKMSTVVKYVVILFVPKEKWLTLASAKEFC